MLTGGNVYAAASGALAWHLFQINVLADKGVAPFGMCYWRAREAALMHWPAGGGVQAAEPECLEDRIKGLPATACNPFFVLRTTLR